MNNSELVSIIIPLFNMENKIGNCLESIFAQSYLNYEIIIVDDGSIDQSKSVVDQIVKQSTKVKYFYQENKGVSNARNKGIALSKGQFILFVDADDIISPDFIENLVINYEEEDDIVLCGLTKICPDSKRYITAVPKVGSFSREQVFHDFLLYQKRDGFYGFVCSKLIKSEILKINDIWFDENIKLSEDLNFFIQYYSYCKRFKFINNNNGYYYAENINSNSKINVDYIQLIGIYIELKNTLQKNNSLNKINKNILNVVFSELKYAYFTELRIINAKNIKNGIKQLLDIEMIKGIRINEVLVRWMVNKEYVFLLIIYLKFRLLYINVRIKI